MTIFVSGFVAGGGLVGLWVCVCVYKRTRVCEGGGRYVCVISGVYYVHVRISLPVRRVCLNVYT